MQNDVSVISKQYYVDDEQETVCVEANRGLLEEFHLKKEIKIFHKFGQHSRFGIRSRDFPSHGVAGATYFADHLNSALRGEKIMAGDLRKIRKEAICLLLIFEGLW
jgi:hypothetical protein